MIYQELTYWVTLALMPKMWTRRKNEIYVKCFQSEPRISIVELFEEKSNWTRLGMSDAEQALFEEAYKTLANNSFLVEELTDQGYRVLPLPSEDYPEVLKKNLGYGAPTVLFAKGNISLLQEPSVAIVGSRNADNISLTFTDNVAKRAASEKKVVVSGFAKGVDRQALDSAIEGCGRSIIVLPQGIMTFAAGFKQYYKQILQGNVLVVSTFAPKAPWCIEFAMARNPIIYGMASEIFVAQSDEKGGTWSGVVDGLRRNRPIFVRYPKDAEKSANILLIQKGAKAVDDLGNLMNLSSEALISAEDAEREKQTKAIVAVLTELDKASSKELITKLHLDWSEPKMRKFLESVPKVQKVKEKNRVYYKLEGKKEQSLFSDDVDWGNEGMKE